MRTKERNDVLKPTAGSTRRQALAPMITGSYLVFPFWTGFWLQCSFFTKVTCGAESIYFVLKAVYTVGDARVCGAFYTESSFIAISGGSRCPVARAVLPP